ncbi:hypothetical protein SAMN04488530_1372 [Asaccharospora irregularis DSM 2635]|uniref:DUF4044 domain-containing protein n=1 Tax=Asaccharospora irregularis DSM 2635 TaxID=1121321 RepID=A0A1M5S492_9FIRM|nr:hypothetical protein SAMN04488530_1372 [Asaccharospora irregularis DSM 2635]
MSKAKQKKANKVIAVSIVAVLVLTSITAVLGLFAGML